MRGSSGNVKAAAEGKKKTDRDKQFRTIKKRLNELVAVILTLHCPLSVWSINSSKQILKLYIAPLNNEALNFVSLRREDVQRVSNTSKTSRVLVRNTETLQVLFSIITNYIVQYILENRTRKHSWNILWKNR